MRGAGGGGGQGEAAADLGGHGAGMRGGRIPTGPTAAKGWEGQVSRMLSSRVKKYNVIVFDCLGSWLAEFLYFLGTATFHYMVRTCII